MTFDPPRILVDFNEMAEPDLVLLSQSDTKADSSGAPVVLREGLVVHLYMDDVDEHGNAAALVADGVVEACPRLGWSAAAKWCCRLDAKGVQHLSTSTARTSSDHAEHEA